MLPQNTLKSIGFTDIARGGGGRVPLTIFREDAMGDVHKRKGEQKKSEKGGIGKSIGLTSGGVRGRWAGGKG